MNIAIIQFPGSNCERETKLAVQRSGMTPVEFLWNESPQKLEAMDGYILIGGFSYEDRSRAGIIAALDPVMQEIKHQSEKGKPVLGICNGAQILVETGLVPGLKNNQLGMALTENKRMVDGKIYGTGFYNAWIHLRPGFGVRENVFTRNLTKDSLMCVPIAHGEGRFVMPESLLDIIKTEGLNGFQYCDAEGKILDYFPVNPNGSLHNLAAVINKAGNVMAMMPHPERTKAGDPIFASIRDSIQENKTYKTDNLAYSSELPTPQPYKKNSQSQELIVQLIITDNQALTVQNALKKLGINVEVTRRIHWEIHSSQPEILEQIRATGVLFNDRKEYVVPEEELKQTDSLCYLVRSKEDLLGQQKMQMLVDQFSLDSVPGITHGILWIFKSKECKIDTLKDALLKTHIISNPFAFECYDYEYIK